MSRHSPEEWFAIWILQVGKIDPETGPYFYWLGDNDPGYALLEEIWLDLAGRNDEDFRRDYSHKYGVTGDDAIPAVDKWIELWCEGVGDDP